MKTLVSSLTICGMHLGSRLKAARMRQRPRVTQDDVAAAAGLTRSRISQIEKAGGDLSAEPALRIADFLKVNVRWLVLGEGPMEVGAEAAPQALPELSPLAIIVAQRWQSLESVAQGRILELIEYLQLVANPRYWGWSETQRKAALVRGIQKTAKGEL